MKDNNRIPNNWIGAVFAVVLDNESDPIARGYVQVRDRIAGGVVVVREHLGPPCLRPDLGRVLKDPYKTRCLIFGAGIFADLA